MWDAAAEVAQALAVYGGAAAAISQASRLVSWVYRKIANRRAMGRRWKTLGTAMVRRSDGGTQLGIQPSTDPRVLMPRKPPKQHVITQSYMKQWADDSNMVGVVCLHHRGSALVPPGALHHVRDLSSPELETRWSGDEHQAMQVIRSFKDAVGANNDEFEEAERYLSDPDRLAVLADFVALHHARSLVVTLQQTINPNATGGSAESEATIRQRWEAVRDHYGRCGIEVTIYPEETPVALGAIPVFDAQDWGGRPPGTARFIMPLTPRSTIGGTPDWPPGRVKVISGSVDSEMLVLSQLAGVPKLFGTPYLICEPSAIQRTAETALRLSEGSNVHWYAIQNRIDLCGERAPDVLRTDWRRRTRRHSRNQALCRCLIIPRCMRAKFQSIMVNDARKVQEDLDDLGVRVCACDQHRRNRDVSGLWNAVMPQVICDEIRRQKNTR